MIDLDAFKAMELRTEPYKCMVVENFLSPDVVAAVQSSYPEVPGPGSHPPHGLKIEGAFKQVVDALRGDEFRQAVEEKFDVDLTDRPTMYTVRGYCRAKDGKIHTDSTTKIVTVLIYMNDASWDSSGGKLRLLNGGDDLEDYFAEVEPKGGTMIIFQRADNSWHGHHSYEGPRRAIQLNWVTSQAVVEREQGRHGLSSKIKKIFGFAKPKAA